MQQSHYSLYHYRFLMLYQIQCKKLLKNNSLQNFESETERVTIVNNEFVEVFIKEEKRNKKKNIETYKTNLNAHYYFNITSGEQFENDLKEFYKLNNTINTEDQIFPDVDTRKDIFGEMFGWLIPIIIMLIIWFYIMKRMSGSGAPGGGLFNIGKSKAELFDKDTKQTNFNDVAGLEGAKER